MKTKPTRRFAGTAQLLGAASLLALAACASTPPPTDALTGAEAAIKRAEQARVDAEVATAKADAAKAAATITEMQKANQALQQEAIRNSTNGAPIVLPAPPAAPAPAPRK